jgi:light-regulated signal transduction histidine kinase (bacteriophytochrome)
MAMVDCADLMGDVLAGLEQRVAETGATISVGELPSIKGAQDELGRVFQNLILNALKFRSEAPPEIHVDAERNGIAWVFSIRDNGIGIDPEQAERIFEMFQRLHGRDQYAGTGMGLAIVKRIVERHGGRVWAEQADGGGTVFRFSVPHAEFSRSRMA